MLWALQLKPALRPFYAKFEFSATQLNFPNVSVLRQQAPEVGQLPLSGVLSEWLQVLWAPELISPAVTKQLIDLFRTAHNAATRKSGEWQ